MSTIVKRLSIVTAASMLFISCSAIKIETGQTQEEAIESAEVQAKQIRVDWANRLQQAEPVEMARLLIQYIDTVMTNNVAYGLNVVAEQWRQGNAGRGEDVPDSEIREMVGIWTETQQPIMAAYEDNIEYGLQRIKEPGYFDQSFLNLLNQFVDQHYKVYSAVFYPSGNVEEYENSLDRIQRETETLSSQLTAELDRY